MDSRPKLDLGFKEGQTIKLSIGVGVIPFLYVLCVWACCLHMFVHHRHSVSGGWKRVLNPLDWSYRWLLAAMWVLGVRALSSGRAVRALHC